MLRRSIAFLLSLLMMLGCVPAQAFAQTAEPVEALVLEEAEEIPDPVYSEEDVLEELAPEQTEPGETDPEETESLPETTAPTESVPAPTEAETQPPEESTVPSETQAQTEPTLPDETVSETTAPPEEDIAVGEVITLVFDEITDSEDAALAHTFDSGKLSRYMYNEAIDISLNVPAYAKVVVDYGTSAANSDFILYRHNPFRAVVEKTENRFFYDHNNKQLDIKYGWYRTYELPVGEYTLRLFPSKYTQLSSIWIRVTADVIPHTCKYEYNTVKPTCTSGGYTTYTCTLCLESHTSNKTKALGHDPVDTDPIEPTCAKVGKTVGKKCSRCNMILEQPDDIPKLPHTPVKGPDEAPGCVTTGKTNVVKCAKCDEILSYDVVPDLGGHIFTAFEGRICATCGDVDESLNLLGHGDCGENAKWFMERGNILRIIGTGDMTDYDDILDTPWNFNQVTKIIIHDGITSIGSNTFCSSFSLDSVSIADSVVHIGARAFHGSGITSITIPGSVKVIDDYAFQLCEDLTQITLSEGLTHIGKEAFDRCKRLKEIIIPDSVTSMGEFCFSSCHNLKNATIGRGLTAIPQGAFAGCGLTGIVFRSDGNLKTIGTEAFANCALTGIMLPYGLEQIKRDAFINMGLQVAYFPATLKVIESRAFGGSSISYIEFGGTQSQWYNVSKSGNSAITGKRVYFTSDSSSNSGSCGSTSWTRYSGTLIISGSGYMADYSQYSTPAWSGTSIKSAVIEKNVSYVGSYAFYNCNRLENIRFEGDAPEFSDDAFQGVTATVTYSAMCDGWDEAADQDYGGTITWVRLPAPVKASGSCGKGMNWSLDAANTLTISGAGSMTDYTQNGRPGWSSYASQITHVLLEEGITSVGSYAFYGCSSLKQITLPGTLNAVNAHAFDGCSGLTAISIPDGVTSLGDCAFRGCSGLKAIVLPEGITVIGSEPFALCSALTSVNLPGSITTIGDGAFYGLCPREIDLSNAVSIGSRAFGSTLKKVTFGSRVPAMAEDAFAGVQALAYYPQNSSAWIASERRNYGGTLTWVVDDPNVTDSASIGSDLHWSFNKSGLLRIFGTGTMPDYSTGNAPWRNLSIKSVVVESGVQNISASAFAGKTSITSLRAANVRQVGANAFKNCTGLTSVSFGNGLASIGSGAFSGCSSITSVSLPGTLETVADAKPFGTNAGLKYTFNGSLDRFFQLFGYGCSVSTQDGDVMVSGCTGETTWVLYDEQTLYLIGTNITTPENVPGAGYVTKVIIQEGAKNLDLNLNGDLFGTQELTIPSTVTSASLTVPYNLRKIHIPSADVWAGIDFTQGRNGLYRGAKLYCSNRELLEVTLSTATRIGNYAFEKYSAMTVIQLPRSIKSFGTGAFDNCSRSLKYTYPGTSQEWMALNHTGMTVHCLADDRTVTDFGTCGTGLTWIYSSDGTLTINGTGPMEDYTYSFSSKPTPWDKYMSKLKHLVVGEGITYIGSYAFQGSKLETAVLPDTVTKIGNSAFDSCYKLEKITMPRYLTEIGSSAFSYCDSLAELYIPKTVTYIGHAAFNGCWLEKIIVDDIETLSTMTYGNLYANPLRSLKLPPYNADEETLREYDNCGIFLSSDPDTRVTEISVSGKVSDYAFIHCFPLHIINVAADTELGVLAFDACANATIHYEGTAQQWLDKRYTSNVTVVCGDGTTFLGSGITDPSDPTFGDSYHDNIRWTLDTTGELRLFGSGEMFLDDSDTTNNDAPWIYNPNPITSAVVEAGITSISPYTFYLMDHAEKIVIGPDVKTIADYAIYGGTGNKTVIFQGRPDTIGEQAFSGERIWAYYRPSDGWTGDMLLDYGGSVIWTPYETEASINIGGPIRILSPSEPMVSGQSVTLKADLGGQTGYLCKWLVDNTAAAAISGSKLTAKKVSEKTSVTVTLIAYPSSCSASQIPNTAEGIPGTLPAGCMYASREVTILPTASGVQILDPLGNAVPSGSTLEMDMAQPDAKLTLRASTLPADALDATVWTCNDTDNRRVHWSADNGTITLSSPKSLGTVTVTAAATDGSDVSSQVKVAVIYVDSAKKLTASTTAPKIGLQPEETAAMQVFGTDKRVPLDSNCLTFSSSDPAVASVDETGTITGGHTPGTATITASVVGDPLNRKVSIMVKVISAQTEILQLIPGEYPDSLSLLDQAGSIVTAPGSAAGIFADKATLPGKVTFLLTPKASNSLGQETNPGLKWASSNNAVASVKADGLGRGLVTINAKADGSCVITATTTDAAKIVQSFTVSVRDYSPRLGQSTLTMNAYLGTGAGTTLSESYGNKISGIRLYEYDAKAKTYAEAESTRLTCTWENGTLTLRNSAVITGTLKVRMVVSCENGENYPYNLQIKTKNTVPSISVKQSGKFNTFLKSSSVPLAVTAKNAQILDIQAPGEHFAVTNGQLTFSEEYLADTSIALDKKVTLLIYLEGYAFPVAKEFTVSTTSVQPALELSAASTSISFLSDDIYPRVRLYLRDKKTKENIDLAAEPYTLSTSVSFLDLSVTYDGMLYLWLDDDAVSTTADIRIQHGSWTQPLVIKHKISVSRDLPAFKLTGGSTIKMNTNYPDKVGTIPAQLTQSNYQLSYFDYEPTAAYGSSQWEEADKIRLDFVDDGSGYSGQIEAEFWFDTPKADTYSFQVTPYIKPDYSSDGIPLDSFTVKVQVSDTKPTVKLKQSTLSLNAVYPGKTASTALTLGTTLGQLTGIDYVCTAAEGSDALIQSEKIRLNFDPKTSLITAGFPGSAPTNGTYSFRITPIMDDEVALKPVTLKVKVHSTVPTWKFRSSSVTLNSVFTELTASADFQISTGSIPNAVTLESTANAGSAARLQAQKIGFANDGTALTAFFLDPEDPAAPGTYTFRCTMEVNGYPMAAKTLKVKVTSAVPKVTLATATVKPNLTLWNRERIPVSLKLSSKDYVLAGFRELNGEEWTYVGNGYDLRFSVQDQQLQFCLASSIARKGTATLTPILRHLASGQEVPLSSQISLKVTPYSKDNVSLTLTAKGKLNTMTPETPIVYTVKKLSNAIDTPAFAGLTGQDAKLFQAKVNEAGQVELRLRRDQVYATNRTYKLQLVYKVCETDSAPGMEVTSPVQSFKVAQTNPKLKVLPAPVTYYQSQSLPIRAQLQLTAPSGATLTGTQFRLNTAKTTAALLNAIDADSLKTEVSADGLSASVLVNVRSGGYLVTGKRYNLVLEVTPAGNASNVKPVQVTISVLVRQ